MTDIIEIIFDNLLENCKPTPERRRMDAKCEELIDSVRPILGTETAEALLANHDAILMQSSRDWFREGIRVGMALMQELL